MKKSKLTTILFTSIITVFLITDIALASDDSWIDQGSDVETTNSGNVGIGTTNPETKLHVNGGVLFNDTNNYMGGNIIQYTYGQRSYRYAMERNGYNLLLRGRNGNPILGVDRLNGSVSNPTPVANDDTLFQLRVSGTNPNDTQTVQYPLTVKANKFSASAKAKIEAAGGMVEEVEYASKAN